MKPTVEVFPDAHDAARACAERIAARARATIGRRGSFHCALTGGSAPHLAYEALAHHHARDVDWKRVHFFIGDERRVPLEDPRSNFGAARRAWLDGLGLPAAQLHAMPVELEPDVAARSYERELRALAPDGLDLVLLGMGEDGHVASLFPDQSDRVPAARWVIATRAPPGSEVEERLSLTFAAIAAAREVLFLVCGASKSDAVADALLARRDTPAARVRAREGVHWVLDAAAARAWRAGANRSAS